MNKDNDLTNRGAIDTRMQKSNSFVWVSVLVIAILSTFLCSQWFYSQKLQEKDERITSLSKRIIRDIPGYASLPVIQFNHKDLLDVWSHNTSWMFDDFNNILASRMNSHFNTSKVTENDTSYIVDLEMPGIEEKNISIKLEGDILKISAKQDGDGEKTNYKSYEQNIKFTNINSDDVIAVYKNGLLQITIKKLEDKPKESKEVKILS